MRLFKYGIYCGSCQTDTSCAGTMLVINLISCPVLLTFSQVQDDVQSGRNKVDYHWPQISQKNDVDGKISMLKNRLDNCFMPLSKEKMFCYAETFTMP